MSAQATVRKRAAPDRLRVLNTVAAAGLPYATIVGAGGLACGFALWLLPAMRVEISRALDDLTFLVLSLTGVAIALGGWSAYAVYFAKRAGVPFAAAARADAFSWAALTLFPVALLQSIYPLTPGRSAALAIAGWALVKLIVAVRFNKTVRDVFLTFVVTRSAIVVIAELAYVLVGQRAGQHIAVSDNPLLAVWGRWDAVHYIDIATHGYYGTDMAFFPLYPLTIRIVNAFVGNALVSGIVVSNVSLFFGLLYCYKLVEHLYGRPVAQRTVFYISIFPTAVFFSAAYTESLFFALTVASFYYIREHKWLLAGALGGLAALTRVEGVLLTVPFLIEAYQAIRKGGGLRAPFAWRAITGAALIPLGLMTYMALLWVIRGDPLYFSHVQAHWNRHLAPPWQSVWHAFKILAKGSPGPSLATQWIEVSFTLLMLAVLLAGMRKLPLSLWTYMALSIVVPMSTSSLMSMPRFALVLFPMFIILAEWGERPQVNSIIVAFSLPLLGLFTVLFANWYWVA